jgi:hypothetical protein
MNPKKVIVILVALGSIALSHPATSHAQEGDGDSAAPAPVQPAVKSSAKSRKTMRTLFKILKQEPTIQKVQKWALGFYKLNPGRIHSMASNARLKALVPELDLSFENNKGNSFGNMRDGLYPILPPNPGGSNPNPLSLKERTAGTSSTNVFRVRAVWNLDRLVFNAEGLDVKSLNSLGETLVREVTTLYYSRRRLLASIIMSPPESPEELFFELTRLDEITSTLDSLTGNKFSKTSWKWNDAMLGI